MAATRGEVLLWADDDVRPACGWIEAMCRPIIDDRSDAVAGRITLPEVLQRPWLQPWHRVCLAVDESPQINFDLKGANMAFARHVLAKVPAFDQELGGGAMGAAEDTLFSRQLATAGYRLLAAAEDSTVLHHCGEHRLTRNSLINVIAQQGRSQAYIDYHWKHRRAWLSLLHGLAWSARLCGVATLHRLSGNRPAVIGRREARWLWRWSYHRQMAREAGRPRHYARFGLEKLVAEHEFTPFLKRAA